MVTKYGMSDTLGTMVYVDNDQDSFFGRMSAKSVSEATQQKVDAEIRRILDEQYSVARTLIEDNRDKVEAMNRSEEHTSELQSLMRISNTVFSLKKKKTS